MSHKSKIRGTRFESALRDWTIEAGFPTTHRRALNGAKDRGDLFGIDDWTLEAKDHAKITLAEYMAELEAEIANAGTQFGAVIVKRRGKGPAHAYAVMPYFRLLHVIAELGAKSGDS